jgi:hypothetical protein
MPNGMRADGGIVLLASMAGESLRPETEGVRAVRLMRHRWRTGHLTSDT